MQQDLYQSMIIEAWKVRSYIYEDNVTLIK